MLMVIPIYYNMPVYSERGAVRTMDVHDQPGCDPGGRHPGALPGNCAHDPHEFHGHGRHAHGRQEFSSELSDIPRPFTLNSYS